jgi:hypothetical protein
LHPVKIKKLQMKKYSLSFLLFCISIIGFTQTNFKSMVALQHFNKQEISSTTNFRFAKNISVLKTNGAEWKCVETKTRKNNFVSCTYQFNVVNGSETASNVAVKLLFDTWSTKNYLIVPAAVYNGNRFKVLKYSYPPLFKQTDYAVDEPVTITDVPRLNTQNIPSKLELTTGDVSTPAIGIYFPDTKTGVWIFTKPTSVFGNNGITLEESADKTKLSITFSAPYIRQNSYSMNSVHPSDDVAYNFKTGDKVELNYSCFTFNNIHSPAELNNQFVKIRKLQSNSEYINQLPFSEAFKIMEMQQNNECWDESKNIYTFGSNIKAYNMYFQLGWVGGCMVTYPLSLCGNETSKNRAFKNYGAVINQAQCSSGFYYSCFNSEKWCGDCFWEPHPDNLLLLRKNADALYYFYKYCLSQPNQNSSWKIPDSWKLPLRKFANAFVTLWKKYGQFGQFIDIETGEIKVGGSNSAAMAIGGLALAAKFENNPEWLAVAQQAARYYYQNYTLKGISCGGPSEILQNNDSESSFAMLESFVVLYEITGKKEWLEYAEDAAAFCSTWMVSYDYRFPENSLFGKLDMKSTGAVWASTQNKHGGPGICTASGDCLLKLYRATGKKIYLEMLKDIAHNIMQYISREDRKIGGLHPGCINERVNLSDWEGKNKVGEIFDGNTWAQVSAMLTVAEVPGIYLNTKTNELMVFDHVDVTRKGNGLTVFNPTKFDADVKIFVDDNPAKPYPQGFVALLPTVKVKHGQLVKLDISEIKKLIIH